MMQKSGPIGIRARWMVQEFGPITGHYEDGEPIRECLKSEPVEVTPEQLPNIIELIRNILEEDSHAKPSAPLMPNAN